MKPVLAFAMGVVVAGLIAYLSMGGKQSAPAPQAAAITQPQSAAPAQPVTIPTVQEPVKAEPATPAPEPAPAVQPKHIVATTSSRRSALGRAAEKKPVVAAPPAAVQAPAQPVAHTEPVPQQTAQVQQPVTPAPATPAPVIREERPAEPPKPEPQTVTVSPGTVLSVRLEETITSDRSQAGDQFRASLAAPLIVNGFVIAERGARVIGRVAEIDKGGKMKGVAHIGLELTSLTTSDGQKVGLRTERFSKQAETSRGRDAAKIGGGAALGAIIGAIAGGGKGAAIGAGVGGAAGAGDVALTRGKPAEIPVETRLSFRIADPITITERLNN